MREGACRIAIPSNLRGPPLRWPARLHDAGGVTFEEPDDRLPVGHVQNHLHARMVTPELREEADSEIVTVVTTARRSRPVDALEIFERLR